MSAKIIMELMNPCRYIRFPMIFLDCFEDITACCVLQFLLDMDKNELIEDSLIMNHLKLDASQTHGALSVLIDHQVIDYKNQNYSLNYDRLGNLMDRVI